MRLIPKASSNRVGEVRRNPDGQDIMWVYVTAVPENNKANKALIDVLSEHLKMPKRCFLLVRGHTNQMKMLKVTV